VTIIEIGICAAALVLIAAFFRFAVHHLYLRQTPPALKPAPAAVHGKWIPSVLCGAVFAKGEKLHSKEIVREKDSIVHMYGCPYCDGDKGSNCKTCPVCEKPMRRDEYLIGRMWL
jgi:hypothetical protein